ALPNINYRAFALSTQTPLVSGSANEPEAAGAIAWILYSAYRETGQERYRIGAEQALEALERQVNNPSYELQLPYGTLAAARMNAEVGATFDVGKLLAWSFDRGPIRGWGTIAGINRGGRSLDGLVGEVDGNGYAFALNGFQQAAALVPVARYDDRYARAIGRWMVNLASASRLFYSTELPAENQDGEAWAYPNDPRGLVAYEALRGTRNDEQGVPRSPYATGDNFAPTNFGLYGSSSVGYLAAVVDSTEVPGVLRLDLRKTDVYRTPSYQSFLIYNPHASAQTVTVPLTFGTYDVYDAVANAFIARGVSGRPAVTIPPDAARVLVFPTAGGTETSVDGRRMVNGIVIDYRDGTAGNLPPRVRALVATDTTLARSQTATLYCTPDDAETAEPTVTWAASRGTLVPSGRTATWSSPDIGDADITCTTSDGARTGTATLRLSVVVNQAPQGVTVGASPATLAPNGTTALTCAATDPDGDALAYTWSVTAGTVSGPGATTTYTAPAAPGVVTATCTATDPSGASATGTRALVVGTLILDLNLDGNADDATVFNHDGTLSGPVPTPGRDGVAGHALRFDGVDDVVTVSATPALTPTERVSVSVWINPSALPSREMFAVSHGSWQNRWKVSLTPEGRPRWTVNTTARIVDLDAPAPVAANTFTHLVGTYDGARMRLYVNGALASDVAQEGAIRTTDLPLLIGQMLPSDAAYNFPGTIDDVRVYNVALTAAEVGGLYQTAAEDGPDAALGLGQPFPNPARGAVTVPLALAREARVTVTVVDALGRTIATLHDGVLAAGAHTLAWGAGRDLAAGVYVVRLSGDAGVAARRVLIVR
ncbi:MAG TPA: LamG-like jellyroll fold domain-containing protein, partial [Rubricoccaceae bacterium]